MEELIRQMQSKRLIDIKNNSACADIIRLSIQTYEYHPDEIEWACRLALVRN